MTAGYVDRPIPLRTLADGDKAGRVYQHTEASGTVDFDMVWTANPEMDVVGDVTISSGRWLEIEAGKTINFDPNVSLTINGTLDMNGTSSSPITFKSTGTTWDAVFFGDGSIGTFRNSEPTTVTEYYVDNARLTFGAGSDVLLEEKVRLIAINGGDIKIDPGAQVCLDPGAEIIADDNSYVNDNGGTICFNGTGSCLATTGGTLKFTSGLTRTVDNGGFIAGFASGGTIEIENDAALVFEDGADFIVEEGTTVKLGTDVDIVVKSDATATVQGSATEPITFTSLDGTPNRSEWGTIYLYGSNNTFDYCTIEGSDWGLKFYGTPSATSGNVVKNCTFKKNDQAIRAENTEVDVTDCTIEDNRHAFVLINNPNGIYLDGNTVKDNDRDGIYAIGSVVDVFNTTLDNNGMGNVSTIHGIWANNSSDIALGSRTYSSNSGGYNTIINNHGAGIYRSSDSYVLAGYYVKEGTEQAGYNSIYGTAPIAELTVARTSIMTTLRQLTPIKSTGAARAAHLQDSFTAL